MNLLLEIAMGEGVGTKGKPPCAADQIRAIELLLHYGWGKQAEFVPIDDNPLELDDVMQEIATIAARLEAEREEAA